MPKKTALKSQNKPAASRKRRGSQSSDAYVPSRHDAASLSKAQSDVQTRSSLRQSNRVAPSMTPRKFDTNNNDDEDQGSESTSPQPSDSDESEEEGLNVENHLAINTEDTQEDEERLHQDAIAEGDQDNEISGTVVGHHNVEEGTDNDATTRGVQAPGPRPEDDDGYMNFQTQLQITTSLISQLQKLTEEATDDVAKLQGKLTVMGDKMADLVKRKKNLDRLMNDRIPPPVKTESAD